MSEPNADPLIARLHLKNSLNAWRALAIIAVVGIGVFLSEAKLGAVGSTSIDSDFIGRVTIDTIVTDDRELLDTHDEFKNKNRGKELLLLI